MTFGSEEYKENASLESERGWILCYVKGRYSVDVPGDAPAKGKISQRRNGLNREGWNGRREEKKKMLEI